MKLTDRETATVLYALRDYQNRSMKPWSGEGLFVKHTPLDSDEVEELCGRINTVDNTELPDAETMTEWADWLVNAVDPHSDADFAGFKLLHWLEQFTLEAQCQ